jgi:hypothetical protein
MTTAAQCFAASNGRKDTMYKASPYRFFKAANEALLLPPRCRSVAALLPSCCRSVAFRFERVFL